MSYRKYHDIDGLRRCRKCDVRKPLTNENYSRNNHLTPPFSTICKECDNEQRRKRWHSKESHNYSRRCMTCGVHFYAALLCINKAKKKGKDVMFCSNKCKKGHTSLNWNGQRQGSGNPNAKVKEIDVINIRRMFKKGSKPKDIANLLNISQYIVYGILSQRTWKHVKLDNI